MGRDKWLGGELGSDGNVYGIPGARWRLAWWIRMEGVFGDGAFDVVRLYLPQKCSLARDRLGWKIKYVKSYLGILRFFKKQ